MLVKTCVKCLSLWPVKREESTLEKLHAAFLVGVQQISHFPIYTPGRDMSEKFKCMHVGLDIKISLCVFRTTGSVPKGSGR